MANYLLDEVALKCADSQYEDFKKSTYEKIYYRVLRELARQYEILERVLEFKNSNTNLENVIELKIPSFKTEIKVYVNNNLFLKNDDVKENTYYLRFINNKLIFNYNPKKEDDRILIYYIADVNKDDYDLEETTPIIPKRFEEEIIIKCCIEIAKLGIPKFGESEKGKKYQNIYNLYAKENNMKPDLLEKKEWIRIKLWQPF